MQKRPSRIVFYILYTLALFSVFLNVAGCAKKDSAKPSSAVMETGSESGKSYTVRFDSNGGSAVGQLSVMAGQTANKPNDPSREGYIFSGWLLNGAAFDFTAPISSDIILTAKWEKIASSSVAATPTPPSIGATSSKAPAPPTSSHSTTSSSSHSGQVN